jgi:membrane protein insertase, yidC/oxa1 family
LIQNLIILTKNTSNLPLFGPIWNLIVSALGYIMNWIYLFLDGIGIPNIGLAIILFTLVTRILLFPTSLKQQKSSRMMQIMQPEIRAVQEKYKNKTDNASMMAQQTEMRAIYEKYGTSMTAGCLPLFLQMPIIFALYRIIMNIPAYVPSVKAVYENVSTAIGGSSAAQSLLDFGKANGMESILKTLHNLGLDDPAKYDSTAVHNFVIDFLYKLNPAQWAKLPEIFPQATEVITQAAAKSTEINSFLGLNLSTAPSAYGFTPNIYWLIPVLAGLSQWASTLLMQKQTMPTATDEADQSQQMMKSMNVMMPLMSVWFCFSFASGIGLYWIASSVFMLLQQLILNWYFGKKSNEELLQDAMAKANEKRAKKGLPPIDEKIVENRLKLMQAKEDSEEKNRLEKIAKQNLKTKESTEFYNQNAKEGSLASKANMVQLYNEKNEKKEKK